MELAHAIDVEASAAAAPAASLVRRAESIARPPALTRFHNTSVRARPPVVSAARTVRLLPETVYPGVTRTRRTDLSCARPTGGPTTRAAPMRPTRRKSPARREDRR